MKLWILIVFVGLLSGCSMQKVESQKLDNVSTNAKAVTKSAKNAVLVELFTSEGCSSCPAAERTLDFLDRQQPYDQAEIIALAFHVDYWNYLGWKDVYSSPLFTQRQEIYRQKLKLSSSYTPQMVVDGRTEFVGSNDRKAADAILAAATVQKGKIDISRVGNELKVTVSGLPEHHDASVFLAIAENGIASAVEKGENAGKKLLHRAVVRELRTLGLIERRGTTAEFTATVEVSAGWNAAGLNLVVFCQENESRRILGAARIPFRPE